MSTSTQVTDGFVQHPNQDFSNSTSEVFNFWHCNGIFFYQCSIEKTFTELLQITNTPR